jgi:hypothetical protein
MGEWSTAPAMPFWGMILLIVGIAAAGWYMTRGR